MAVTRSASGSAVGPVHRARAPQAATFNADEPGYTTLKAVLDGSVAATPENVLLYATSNRRHLMPEFMRENLETTYLGDEIHPGETVEEKISLS